MDIKINNKEVILMEDFELKWRWEKAHNSEITSFEINQIQPLSENESIRLDKIISYFEQESNIKENYIQTDWINDNSENNENIEQFRNQAYLILEQWNEDVIINWNKTTCLKTTKEIFLKYWDDFCYPSSDDVTIISEKTNWIIFYRHYEVANIWTKK